MTGLERVRLLIQAAREVKSARLRDELLVAAEEEIRSDAAEPIRRMLGQFGEPQDVQFPLDVFMSTPSGEAQATMYENCTIEFRGKRYSSPSSNDLMLALGHKPGNAWPRWRFQAPDGRELPIKALKQWGLVNPIRGRSKKA